MFNGAAGSVSPEEEIQLELKFKNVNKICELLFYVLKGDAIQDLDLIIGRDTMKQHHLLERNDGDLWPLAAPPYKKG